MRRFPSFSIPLLLVGTIAFGEEPDTLPSLTNDEAPRDLDGMWAGFDPRAEPLETETLAEWQQDGVVLRVVRFRIGVFKGKKATLAGIYGLPENAGPGRRKPPGLVQIHGGGQSAHYRACLLNAKRGYATLSIAWAGRIDAPAYRVTNAGVKLQWDGKVDDPEYRPTTDWGALDAYHAPSRMRGTVFPSAKPTAWTLDEVESPRNSPWFLCALAARRALTFLERQPEVDPDRLGVYGHSMGGKLTVMASIDSRVKAAAPSCGGISDRLSRSPLFRSTVGDDVSLRRVSCPIVFLSPSNDFHGRIGDLPSAVHEIASDDWRIVSSPHHNHQDTPAYEVATLLWFDQHLKGSFSFPQTPESAVKLNNVDGVPSVAVRPDDSRPIRSIDVYYTQDVPADGSPEQHEDVMHRFWHHAEAGRAEADRAEADRADGAWVAKLPVGAIDRPLWVFASVEYSMDVPVTGAGYYYAEYTATTFCVSSLLEKFTPDQLRAASVRPTLTASSVIEDFGDDWETEWFTYRPGEWARTTHKIGGALWRAPENATLVLGVRSETTNSLVVRIDGYAAVAELVGGARWQTVRLAPDDFVNDGGEPLSSWKGIRRLTLGSSARLGPKRTVGGRWKGADPTFRTLEWRAATTSGE